MSLTVPLALGNLPQPLHRILCFHTCVTFQVSRRLQLEVKEGEELQMLRCEHVWVGFDWKPADILGDPSDPRSPSAPDFPSSHTCLSSPSPTFPLHPLTPTAGATRC